jgi:hypothetical protein
LKSALICVAMVLVTTLAINVVSGTAHAGLPHQTQSQISAQATQPRDAYDGDDRDTADKIRDQLRRVPRDAPPTRAAQILFPRDPTAQRDYLEVVQHPRFPPALAVFVPILARCVVGAVTGVALNELLYAASARETFKVQSIVDGVLTGCIGNVLLPGLKDVALAARGPLVTAIATVVIYLTSKFKRPL